MGKRRKKSRPKNQPAHTEPEELVKAPHSFVFQRGVVGKVYRRLVKDFRRIMEPFTASNLKPRNSNCMKDFVAVSGVLHVSHLVVFTQTTLSPYMRIVKTPRGPTLVFKIHNYALSTDVLSSLKKMYNFSNAFKSPPLVILNGFSGDEPHIKLMVATFQGMFPTINVTTVKIKHIRRCLLFNYNAENKTVDVRHYVIKALPVGISKAVKRLNKTKIPDLSRFRDISEFLLKSDLLSDSEVEDDPLSHVDIPQDIGRRTPKGIQAKVRLTEYGPRLTLQLIKVEAGVMEGEVMFHEYVTKTEEEKEILRKRLADKGKLKEKRKLQQNINVKRKEREKENAKQRSLEGMKRAGIKTGDAGGSQEQAEYVDDDAEWYRKEVGEEPDPELFKNTSNKKPILKRRKTSDDDQEAEGRTAKMKPRFSMKNNKNSKRVNWPDEKGSKKKRLTDIREIKSNKIKTQQRKGQAKKGRKNLGTKVTKGKRH